MQAHSASKENRPDSLLAVRAFLLPPENLLRASQCMARGGAISNRVEYYSACCHDP